MPPKRKASSSAAAPVIEGGVTLDRSKIRHTEVPLPPNATMSKPSRRQSARGSQKTPTNPNDNPDILDGPNALRASPDGHECGRQENHMKSDTGYSTANGISTSQAATTERQAYVVKATNGTSSGGIANTNGASGTIIAELPIQQPGKGKRKKAAAPVKLEEEESNIHTIKSPVENVTGPTADAEQGADPEDAEGLEDDVGEVQEALSRPPPVNSDYLPLPWKGRLGYVSAS